MPKFWLWLLAASLFYCEMIAKQDRLDTCFCENTLLDVNCFRQWTSSCGEKNGAHNSNALSDHFGVSGWLSLAGSGAGLKDSEDRHNMGDLVSADPADHASVHIHHLK